MITTEYTIPGLHVREHEVAVPLDWDSPDDGTITVFARELVAAHRRHEDLPLLLHLQGGPGGKGPRPTDAGGWIGALLERYRLVLLDQRGTGRSSRVDAARIAAFDTGAAGAEFLARFRADSIVRDAEHLRATEFGGRRWATIGQSYGGWLTLTYLSMFPEALTACLVMGGLASLHPSAAEVYRRTFPRALAKNREYERRYPGDTATIARLADLLAAEDVRLPDGDRLTVPRLQFLGNGFGMQHGFEDVHWLVDEALTGTGGRPSDGFLAEAQARSGLRGRPAVGRAAGVALRRPRVGTDRVGGRRGAGAASRVRPRRAAAAVHGRGDVPLDVRRDPAAPAVRPGGRRARGAHGRGHRSSTGSGSPRTRCRSPRPCTSTTSTSTPGLQLETAAAVGNLQSWVTDEWEHDGVRASGDRVVRRLLALIDEQGGPLPV